MVTLTIEWWALVGWVFFIGSLGWCFGGALAYHRVSQYQLEAIEVLQRPRCAQCGSDACDTLKRLPR